MGKFPHVTFRGSKYFLIIYNYDVSMILTKTLKSESTKETDHAWKELRLKLANHGHKVKYYLSDNEVSTESKKMIGKR